MIEELDNESLVAEVILSHDSGQLVVVVEGDLDSAFVNELAFPNAAVVIARGKNRILAESDSILNSGTPVLILLDRDFDAELGLILSDRRVIYTQRYNLEATLLLDSGNFARIWELNLRPNHRALLPASNAASICEEMASVIGKVRFISVSQQIGLNLEDFPVRNVIPPNCAPRDIRPSDENVIRQTLARSARSAWLTRRRNIKEDGHIDRACVHLRRELRRSCGVELDYCSGHDAAKMLNVLLQRIRRTGVPSASELEWQALHEAKKAPPNSLAIELRSRALEQGFEMVEFN